MSRTVSRALVLLALATPFIALGGAPAHADSVPPVVTTLVKAVVNQVPTGPFEVPLYIPSDAANLPTEADTGDFGFEVNTLVQVDPVLTNATETGLRETPVPYDCDPSWNFDPVGSAKRTWRFDNRNGNKVYHYGNEGGTKTQSFSVTSSRGGSRGITVGGGVEAEFGVLLAKMKTTFHIDVSGEQNWNTAQTATMNIPAGKIGHMGYGVYGYEAKGNYYHINSRCTKDINKGVITVWAPSYDSWRYWEEAVK